MAELQERARRWHSARFPNATQELVALKGVSEVGEVADSILAEIGTNSATGHIGDGIARECADVVICMMVLVSRFHEVDLLNLVDQKLAVLENPASGHPAALHG